jgi:hypothetical protein
MTSRKVGDFRRRKISVVGKPLKRFLDVFGRCLTGLKATV